MCGIVGCIGKIDARKYLIDGLKKLEYRGYDSAGLAYLANRKVNIVKVTGRVSALDEATPADVKSRLGIAHTRWATHGQPNAVNAHPHQSNKKLFTIVHNGVIENYRPLSRQLKVRGFTFKSTTDTEVIANELERFYIRSGSVLEAMAQAATSLEGSYALAIIFSKEPNRLYFMKKSSPLLIGVGDGFTLLASDSLPMIEYTDKFIDLEDGEYGVLTESGAKIYKDGVEVEPTYVIRDAALARHDLGVYPHYMLKEIEEIPSVIRTLVDNYFDGSKYTFNPALLRAMRKTKKIHFLACGTSYYASKIGAKYFRPLGKQVLVSIASEWAYDPYDVNTDTLFILLSQSGETADLIKCLKIINERDCTSLAVTNTKGSSIDRLSTFSCMLYAGMEVAVASTKSYVAQVCFLGLLTGALTNDNAVIPELDALHDACVDVIARKAKINAIAKGYKNATSAFFLGRGYDALASMEAALKLKEVAYVHAEAYQAGELKHGPIALVDENMLIVGMVSDPVVASAVRNNFEEVRARNGKVVVISTSLFKQKGDDFVVKDIKASLCPCLLVLVTQYFAYYLALEKGLAIDKPRNLAKSVTVE